MAFSKTIEKKKLIIHCDVCFEEITLRPFVKCAECIWEQCMSCFLKEIETDSHKKTHNFRIVDNMEKIIFDSNWRMIDELIFLNGTIKFGVGNFEDLSFVLSKPILEVKRHFFWLTGIFNNEEGEIERNEVVRSEPYDREVLSYMPERRDFESEIHNEYEALIAGLKFLKNDSETERNLKKHMLNNYRVILRQRRMWKEFILDRNLIRVNVIKGNESKKEISNVTYKHKWLSGYLSKNDFNYFISCLLEEDRLRRKVESEQKQKQISVTEDELDNRMDELDNRMDELDNRMDELDNRIIRDKLDNRMDELDNRIIRDKLDNRIIRDKLDNRIIGDKLDNRIIGDKIDKRRWKDIEKQELGIDGEIMNFEQIIGDKEKEFCKRLNISVESYGEIKAYALECYIMKVPFKNKLSELFDKSENERVELLYKWFENQKITYI